jgi:hypothetical protein
LVLALASAIKNASSDAAAECDEDEQCNNYPDNDTNVKSRIHIASFEIFGLKVVIPRADRRGHDTSDNGAERG